MKVFSSGVVHNARSASAVTETFHLESRRHLIPDAACGQSETEELGKWWNAERPPRVSGGHGQRAAERRQRQRHPVRYTLMMMWTVFPTSTPPPALDETSYEAGIKVQLHTQSEPPFLHELGFGVAPGFQTFVSTQEQRVAYDCLDLLACYAMTVLSRQLHTHHRVHPRSVATPPFLPQPLWGMDPSVLSTVWLKQPHATFAVCPCR